MIRTAAPFAVAALAALASCSEKTDAEFRAEVIGEMRISIAKELQDLVDAVQQLQAAAPRHAWHPMVDAVEIAQMRDAWRRSRIAYEHVEGVTSPLFEDLEFPMDARYDEYLAMIGPDGDHDLFDGDGVIGMHGLERILYAPEIHPDVLDYERSLPGYEPAAYPETDDEAIAFKTGLVQRLVDDAVALRDRWGPAAIDIGAVFQGLVGLMNEQQDKIDLAADGAQESRYANITLFDLRNNLAGTKGVYDLFRPWIRSRDRASEADEVILMRFRALTTLYGMMPGDALPPVPPGWSSEHPTPAHLATPFGKLWQAVHDNVDAASDGSIVFEMNVVAMALGFPEFISDEAD